MSNHAKDTHTMVGIVFSDGMLTEMTNAQGSENVPERSSEGEYSQYVIGYFGRKLTIS